MTYLWDRESTSKLIELWECAPELWNVSLKEYRDKEFKEKSTRAIAESLGVTPKEVNRKLHNLRCQLNSELRKYKKRKTEEDSDDVKQSSWEYFEKLKFVSDMSDFVEPTETTPRMDCQSQDGEVLIKKEQESDVTSHIPRQPRVRRKKKKKTIDDCNAATCETIITDGIHEINNDALTVFRPPKDDCDVFGEFIAVELRQIRSEFRRRELKRNIQKLIIQMGEEEDSWDSSSVHSASRNYTFSKCTSSRDSP